jgi:pimeloyl-ACP methyl ester carboxylesterase
MLPVTDTKPLNAADAKLRPAFICGHSFGSSRREWTEASAMLADKFRTIAVDTPGFGDANTISGYTVAEMVDHYVQTIKGLELDRYVLVGHSMTGKVAAIVASKAEEYGIRGPEKLVLITPTPLGVEPISEEMINGLLHMERNRENCEKFVLSHSHVRLPQPVQDRAIEDVMRVNQAAWEAWLAHGTQEDWISRASPIKTETLIITAEFDPEWSEPVQNRLTVPHHQHARVTTIMGSGHLIPMEAPKALVATLREFVGD